MVLVFVGALWWNRWIHHFLSINYIPNSFLHCWLNPTLSFLDASTSQPAGLAVLRSIQLFHRFILLYINKLARPARLEVGNSWLLGSPWEGRNMDTYGYHSSVDSVAPSPTVPPIPREPGDVKKLTCGESEKRILTSKISQKNNMWKMHSVIIQCIKIYK